MNDRDRKILDDFHKLFYDKRIFKKCQWLGRSIWKSPLDLWVYQEIVSSRHPDLIIETGSYRGASAHFLKSMMNLANYEGEVVSIDTVFRKDFPELPGLTFLTGSSTDSKIVNQLEKMCKDKTVMVILDSDHRKSHVLKELHIYSKFVTPRKHLIVEDTNLNGHPVITKGFNGKTPGPMEAVEEFMVDNKDFRIDLRCEKFLLTMHPKGFLIKNG